MSPLTNQIAVVTGAGRGIGRAIALKFANEGADVVVVSRTQENSEKVAAEIRALGRKAWAHAVDVADAAAVSAAAEKILAETTKVDILVNNAGVTRDGLLMRMSDADWDTVLDTNLKGAFLVTKAFSRAMIGMGTPRPAMKVVAPPLMITSTLAVSDSGDAASKSTPKGRSVRRRTSFIWSRITSGPRPAMPSTP